MIKGAIIGGYALAAAPAEQGASGVMTFIVSNDGGVYQKDLGPDSPEAFRALEVFNPDEAWTAVPVDEEYRQRRLLHGNRPANTRLRGRMTLQPESETANNRPRSRAVASKMCFCMAAGLRV